MSFPNLRVGGTFLGLYLSVAIKINSEIVYLNQLLRVFSVLLLCVNIN